MSKFNPKNQMDAYCYQITDAVRVLQVLAKQGDLDGFDNQSDYIIILLSQAKHTINVNRQKRFIKK